MKRNLFDRSLDELVRDGYVTVEYDPEHPDDPWITPTKKTLELFKRLEGIGK